MWQGYESGDYFKGLHISLISKYISSISCRFCIKWPARLNIFTYANILVMVCEFPFYLRFTAIMWQGKILMNRSLKIGGA